MAIDDTTNPKTPPDRSRRAFTAVAAATAVAPFMIWSRKATAAEQVIVRTPGGVFDDVKKETVYDPFRKETGIEVVPVAATSERRRIGRRGRFRDQS